MTDAPSETETPARTGTVERAVDRATDALAASTPYLALAVVQLLVVVGYAFAADVTVIEPHYAFYPVVWVTVGVAAVVHAPDAVGSRRRRAAAAVVALAYLAALAWFTGTVFLMPEWMYSVSAYGGLPGWAPVVTAMVGPVAASLVPFVAFGYVVLAYLTYVSLTRATRGLAAAVLGPATCVGCTAAAVTGVLGVAGGVGATGALTGVAYDGATVVYVVAVALLALVD